LRFKDGSKWTESGNGFSARIPGTTVVHTIHAPKINARSNIGVLKQDDISKGIKKVEEEISRGSSRLNFAVVV